MKEGMKRTEAGGIPEDWKVKTISEIITEISMGPFGSDIKVSNFTDRGVPVLNGYNVSGIKLKNRHSNFVTKAKAKDLKKALAKRGDIVVTHRGTIGQIAYIPHDSAYEEYVISQSQFRFSLNSNEALPEFVVYFFHSNNGQNIISETKGHTGVPAIAQATTTFRKISIPLPPLSEQKAIANALRDADAWVESLETLIEKKHLTKQGVMQELSKPKEGWTEKKLSEIGYAYGGLQGKTKKDFNKGNAYYIPFLNVINNPVIKRNDLELVQINPGEIQNSVRKGDVLLNGSSETPEELGFTSVLLNDIPSLYLNSFCFGFRIQDANINPLFFSYLMRSDYGRRQIFHLAQGATRYNLAKSSFLKLTVSLPNSLEEQTRIADTLSDLDAEIEILEQKLSKAIRIKQGMMQQLLTGQIRLLKPAKAAVKTSKRVIA